MVVFIHDGQRVELVLPDDVVSLLERVVDGEGILLDELDFLPGRELEGNGVIGVHQGVMQLSLIHI